MLSLALVGGGAGGPLSARVYELRTYTTEPGRLDALMTRFHDHTPRIFEKHGMENVLYTVPMEEKDGAGNTLVYFLAHESREAATASWQAFRDDPEWKAVAAASQVDGKIVSKVESVFLTATAYSPVMTAPQAAAAGVVFELRTYTTAEGKLPALDARFAGGEIDLFEKQGMKRVGFFHPLEEKDGSGRTLIYVMAHQSRDAATASWQGFRTDPAWVAMKTETEANGKLTEKVVAVFLAPTDFSPAR